MANQFANSKQQFVMILLFAILGFILIFDKTSAMDPLVETGVSSLSPDGKHVAVNVPPFFKMVLDTRGPLKGLKMSQSVMSGLVTIDMDRERDADGKLRGPIDVKVGGMTMYNNQQEPLSSSDSDN